MKPEAPSIRPERRPSVLPRWAQAVAERMTVRDAFTGEPVSEEKKELALLVICRQIEAFVEGR